MNKKQLQIINTADELFCKFGMKRVTVEEICSKASVSKMTFYKYYKNKNELIKAIWNKLLDEGYAKLDEIKIMNIPFVEKIKLILQLKEENLKKYSPDFITDYLNATPEMEQFFKDYSQRSLQRFIEFIKESQAKGDVRPEMRPEFLIAVLNKLMELAKDKNLISQYPDYKDFVLEVNNFLFYGIMPADKNHIENESNS